MRDCWIEHDRCAVNCPCNAECLGGCPEPNENHECKTWFCLGHLPAKTCKSENDANRKACPAFGYDDCLAIGCCYTPYNGNRDVPWCYYADKEPLPTR